MEYDYELACELEWVRLDTIGENRAGGEKLFWLQIWSVLFDKQDYIDRRVMTL